jgi:hypothetical protein
MSAKIIYSEQQKFSQLILWISTIGMLSVPGIFIWAIIQQIIRGEPWGDNPMDNTSLIITFIIVTLIMLFLIILFFAVRLETHITSTEISVKYFPFHRSFKIFKWEDISNTSVQKINPLKYGGWGIRTNSGIGGLRIGLDGIKITNFLYGKNTIFSVSGKYVLKLELKDGKTIMIGTQNEKELEAIIYQIERQNKEY